MEWHHPEILYLILPLCASWLALTLYSDARRRVAAERFAAASIRPRVLPTPTRARFWIRTGLQEAAIVLGVFTLAGPRFGTEYEQIIPRGSDLYVLIDVSRSMLADDVPPSRLGRATIDVAALVNRLEGERIGLIAFAGQAVVKCPLTVDYDSFRRALNELNPDSAPRGGTAIGDAIRKALEVFQANADRDQAILLITDGDDQQSYPMEAAALASERQVTIFTVGLGDAQQGSRIPGTSDSRSFIEYQGEQVWSRLNGDLLRDIALKTSGVYVPAGTRAYDLGELYAKHLQGRRGGDGDVQQRIRRSEQFQIFLLLTIVTLLLELSVSRFRRDAAITPPSGNLTRAAIAVLMLSVFSACSTSLSASESGSRVREGIQLYGQENYTAAQEQFAAAAEQLEQQNPAQAAIAAFDEACSLHRQGEYEKAVERYLEAGLSRDRSLATAAHFNIGSLAAEQAKQLAGAQPELVPVDKRPEILDKLQQAVAAWRHCIELQPDHAASRRNLELVRQWIRYYTNRWAEIDRQKRRDESSLMEFLEFLIDSQTALKKTVEQLPANTRADTYFDLKQRQQDLLQELPTVKEKIDAELRAVDETEQQLTDEQQKEIDAGISLLQSWSDTAANHMSAAVGRLGNRDSAAAVPEQQAATDQLERIRDAVIPFQPLLQQVLARQTTVAADLTPEYETTDATTDATDASATSGRVPAQADQNADEAATGSETIPKPVNSDSQLDPEPGPQPGSSAPQIETAVSDDQLLRLLEQQRAALRQGRLLAPKAQAELNRLNSQGGSEAVLPTQPGTGDSDTAPADPSATPAGPDPEAIKEGYLKAIELAPQAVEQMEAAVGFLERNDPGSAAPPAEEARRILEEVMAAQPKNEQQNQQNQQQDQQQQNSSDQQQKDQQQNQQQNKPDDQQKNEPQDEESKPNDQQQNSENETRPEISQDRLEEALRKVREREQEKREREREIRGRLIGRPPVEKDW